MPAALVKARSFQETVCILWLSPFGTAILILASLRFGLGLAFSLCSYYGGSMPDRSLARRPQLLQIKAQLGSSWKVGIERKPSEVLSFSFLVL